MISGFFVPQSPYPRVHVAVWVESITPDWVLVPFLIDPGAGSTTIHALDAMRRLGMTPSELNPLQWSGETGTSLGVGGSVSQLVRPAQYAFMHDDGTPQIISGRVRIGEMSTNTLPSLLGWDLLQRFRLTVDGRERTVTLERR